MQSLSIHKNNMIGGNLSPLIGPVDMLQMKKQLLMDGYRFQNPLYPPIDNYPTGGTVDMGGIGGMGVYSTPILTELDPLNRQRVGTFRQKAFIIDRKSVV